MHNAKWLFKNCLLYFNSPTSNKTGYVNVTIFEKQPDCNIPDYLIYSTTSGSEKNSLIFCPTINRYNWTQPVEWFKVKRNLPGNRWKYTIKIGKKELLKVDWNLSFQNCEVLQEPRYLAHKSFLLIDDATNKDTGDYTCKFIHNEYGVKYIVTATKSFTVTGKLLNVTRAILKKDKVREIVSFLLICLYFILLLELPPASSFLTHPLIWCKEIF